MFPPFFTPIAFKNALSIVHFQKIQTLRYQLFAFFAPFSTRQIDNGCRVHNGTHALSRLTPLWTPDTNPTFCRSPSPKSRDYFFSPPTLLWIRDSGTNLSVELFPSFPPFSSLLIGSKSKSFSSLFFPFSYFPFFPLFKRFNQSSCGKTYANWN